MPVEIIAEIAQGYEGDPGLGRLLTRAAARAEADAVKCQVVYADELATEDYQYFGLFRKLEMPDAAWQAMRELAREEGLAFYLDVFGHASLALAERLAVEAVGIHSTDLLNTRLLAAVERSTIPRVFLGVGGAMVTEVDEALALLKGKAVVLIHGFQAYPTQNGDNQIARIGFLRRHCEAKGYRQVTFGFGDHVPKDDALRLYLAGVAIGQGAAVIEKHLTLASTLCLEDHEAAVNPDEFRVFANAMRVFAEALGEVKEEELLLGMSEGEQRYRRLTRKHVVADCPIKMGHRIDAAMLTLKRSPAPEAVNDLQRVIGRVARQDMGKNQTITSHCVEEACR